MDAAPLIATPDAPIPARGDAEWFTSAGGLKLRAAIFRPEGAPRGSVVINTGRTETIEKYFEIIRELLARGFVVLVHDWRGQGLSQRLLPDRLLGHADGFDDFIADFRTLLGRFEARLPKPWVLLGHSMGGCVSLLALTGGETRFSACVLTSPMLGLKLPHSPWLVRAKVWFEVRFGRAEEPVDKRNPKTPQDVPEDENAPDPYWARFEGNVFTHDRVRHARYHDVLVRCPDLALGAPTYGWLNAALAATATLQRRAATSIPVVILSAAEDTVVDNAAQRTVAALLPDARVVEVPGARHEILLEVDACRDIFWREFDAVVAALPQAPSA